MIHYLKGDATAPIDPNRSAFRVIAHICNDKGGWGAGFVVHLSNRWSEPENHYRMWRRHLATMTEVSGPFALGSVQVVKVERDLWVANMIAQEGYGEDGRPPIRYDALETCLHKLADVVGYMIAPTIHMPRIGCGLAGGRWEMVEPIINRTLGETPVYVYDIA